MAKFIVPIGAAGSGKSTAAGLLRMLAQERGLVVQELAFAAPLKAFCHDVFRFDPHALYGPSEARNANDPRYTREGNEEGARAAWLLAHERLHRDADHFIERVLPNFGVDDYGKAVDALVRWFHGLRALPTLSARVALQTLGTDWGRALYDRIWIDVAKRAVDNSPADLVVATDGRFLNEAKDSGGFPILIQRDGALSALGSLQNHASEKDQGSQEMLDYCSTYGAVVDNNGSLDSLRDQLLAILDQVMA